jgi:Protein of unknown function (DUF2742)
VTTINHTTDYRLASRSVDWWSVHQYVEPLLQEVGSWPMAGSLAWQRLDDDDPAKRAALYDSSQHWVLRVDTSQAALAQASRDVSAAYNWAEIARSIRQRNEVYIPRRAS